uniref:RRM domain-containing protein n=1 Tax=Ananas comosus var. bracteatus TaxID=296719 RepID=A0A6V7PDN5_ANACO|nr:unnamed protein product [Ananas comosus var. bracteatus]
MASTSSSYALHDPSVPPGSRKMNRAAACRRRRRRRFWCGTSRRRYRTRCSLASFPLRCFLCATLRRWKICPSLLFGIADCLFSFSLFRLRNCAFVDFKDEMLANQALSQLNRYVILRLRFLGKVLTVERANQGNLKNSNQHQHHQDQLVKGLSHPPISLLKDSSKNTNNLTHGGEPIAPRLGVDYPFPPHLEYEYPPPDGNILTNIVNALIAVPRFYTQVVLHLMNKMNIPAPFRMALPTPPLPPQVPAPPPPPPPSSTKPQLTDLSSDESEMESSDEDRDDTSRRKRAKREAIVGPAVDKGVAHEAVGLKPAMLVPKEVLKIKKKNPVLQINIGSKPMRKEIAEHENNTKELAREEEHLQQKHFATPKEIESGKLPRRKYYLFQCSRITLLGILLLFSTSRIWRRMSFQMTFILFLARSLFESVDAARSGLHIKLMQEGRMRGQAFVTFPSVDLAQHALNLANGYVFKGKAMIIQFGRNPVAGKAT